MQAPATGGDGRARAQIQRVFALLPWLASSGLGSGNPPGPASTDALLGPSFAWSLSDLWADVVAGEGPTTPNQMPPVYRPDQLDWGDAPETSAVAPSSPLQPLTYFTRNHRFVYELWLVPGQPPVPWRKVPIPKCWDDGRPVRLARPMAVLETGATSTVLVLCLGRWGEEGLATVTIGLDGSATWLRHPPHPATGQTLDCHARQDDANVSMAVSADWIFVSRGGRGGVAIYKRSDRSYFGSFGMPGFAGSDLTPTTLTHLTGGAGREFLLAGVKGSAGTSSFVPRVLVYEIPKDLGSPELSLRRRLLLSSCGADSLHGYSPPGSGPACGAALLTAVVATPIRVTHMPVTSISVQRMPDTLTDGSAPRERALLLVATQQTIDAVDLSAALGESAAPPANPTLEAELASQLTGVGGRVQILTAVLDTYALSDGYCVTEDDEPNAENCGTPQFMQCDPDYSKLRSTYGRGLVMAGRYAAIGWAGARGDGPSNALNLIALAYAATDLQDLRLRLVGLAAPKLDEVRQFETMSPFHHVMDINGQDWLLGAARASFGLVGFQLPSQELASCAADYVEAAGFFLEGGSSTGQTCSCEGGFPAPHNAPYAFETILPSQHSADCLLPVDCRARLVVPTGCKGAVATGQLPLNLVPGVASEGLTGSAQVSAWGYGQEFLGGTVVQGVDQHALLMADRSSNAIWAYLADVSEAPILDTEGGVQSARAVTSVPWAEELDAPGDPRLVVAVGMESPLTLLQWRWSPPPGDKPLERRLAVVPRWSASPPGHPKGYQSVVALPDPDASPLAQHVPWSVAAGVTVHTGGYFGGFDVVVMGTDGLGEELDANLPQLEALLADPAHRVDVGGGATGLYLDELPAAGRLRPPPVTFFRFGRTCTRVENEDGDLEAALHTVIEPRVGDTVDLQGEVRVLDLAQHDRWLYALLRCSLDANDSQFWLVTFEVVPLAGQVPLRSEPWCAGLDPAEGQSVEAKQGCRGTGGALSLQVMSATALRSPAFTTDTEPGKLAISPGGDFLLATGEGPAGCWLVHSEMAGAGPGVPPTVQVVAGLRKDAVGWYGWPIGPPSPGEPPRTLDWPLVPARPSERNLDVYPTWPIRDPDDLPDITDGNCADRYGTDLGSGVQGWPNFWSVAAPMQAASFVEQEGELFLFLNTDPVTVWHVGRADPVADPWTYIGAVCTESRLRVSLVVGDFVWMAGNAGAFTIPTWVPWGQSGCCAGVE